MSREQYTSRQTYRVEDPDMRAWAIRSARENAAVGIFEMIGDGSIYTVQVFEDDLVHTDNDYPYMGHIHDYIVRVVISRAQVHDIVVVRMPNYSEMSSAVLSQSALDEIGRRLKRNVRRLLRIK